MRILFDQGTPVPIAAYLRQHTVRTIREEGWGRLSNGDLLQAAESAGFDQRLTTDNNLGYQQNLKDRRVAIVVLGGTVGLSCKRRIRKIVAAVNAAAPGSYIEIDIAVR